MFHPVIDDMINTIPYENSISKVLKKLVKIDKRSPSIRRVALYNKGQN